MTACEECESARPKNPISVSQAQCFGRRGPAPAMIRLLVLDVEGVITLAGGSQYPWPLEEMLAVRRALATASFGCILCTGRQVPYGEAVIQALDLFRPLRADAAAHVRAI